MNCRNNKKVIKNKEMNFCIKCGTIYDYDFVHESIFREYNLNIDNMLQYKKSIYRRKKYLSKKCSHIDEINNNILLYFDKSLEQIRKVYKMKRIPISKYLNSIYKFYCDKAKINYQDIFKNKKINDFNNDIIKILEQNCIEYPYVKFTIDDRDIVYL